MRVPDEIRRCVAFLFLEKDDATRVPIGTAFFVSHKRGHALGGHWIYAVTARHILAQIRVKRPDGNFLVRMNSSGQTGVIWIPTNVADWRTHPDESLADDVAIAAWTPTPGLHVWHCPLEASATPDVMKANDIGVGDELFFPGLFASHVGEDRNIPIVRTGNLAAIPEEPVRTQHFGRLEAYLAEARSLGGLSGSPVFVNLGLFRRLRGEIHQAEDLHSVFYLLGMVHGHYEVARSTGAAPGERGVSLEAINQGLAIVVPVTRILDGVHRTEWVTEREKTDAAHEAASAERRES